MVARLLSVLALALVLTCAPTAIPRSESGSPSPSLGPIATDDVITLREGGSASMLAVRKVATSELVGQMLDGILLPDGTSVFVLEPDGGSTILRLLDRRTGKSIAGPRTVAGTWVLGRGGPDFAGASPGGSFVTLLGSSYNFTDASGTWTAKTTFAVIDTALKRSEPLVVELDGRYGFEGISSDGRSLYLRENVPPQQPTSSRLRVYDLSARAFADVAFSELPDMNNYFRPTSVNIVCTGCSGLTYELLAGRDTWLMRRDLNARTMTTAKLPADQGVSVGEGVLMWSLTASRDGRSLYAVNPMLGVIDEFDPMSLGLRRTAHLAQTKSERGLMQDVVAFLHPIAVAKRGFNTGAVLSPEGAILYALGETGVWKIDLASLKGTPLTKDGVYESIALSPDGMRLYVLSFEDGIVRALSYRDGTLLGAMKRIAYPSDIVAVDLGK